MLSIFKYKFTPLFLIVLIFGLSQWVLNKLLHLQNASWHFLSDYSHKKGFFALLNSPHFWNSIAGSSLKILLDVSIVSLIIYFTDQIFNRKLPKQTIYYAVCFSQLVFLFQFLSEFILFKIQPILLQKNEQQQFSIFSVAYFFKETEIDFPIYFQYAFQTLGLFEFLYWIILSWLLFKFSKSSFFYGFKVVMYGYVPLLLIWLLFITFLLFLKS